MVTREKKLRDIGPGGLRCVCCADKPGTRPRRKVFRKARREDKRQAIAESIMDESLQDLEEEVSLEIFFGDELDRVDEAGDWFDYNEEKENDLAYKDWVKQK